MGFSEAVHTVYIKKYATFSGRASRSEYWWSILAALMFGFVAGIIIGVAGGFSGDFEGNGAGNMSTISAILFIIFGLIYLAVLLPLIAVVVRRLHDRDMSGWWYLGFILLSIIPFVGFFAQIAFLVILCLKGTDGENRFGPDPLNEGATAEVFA